MAKTTKGPVKKTAVKKKAPLKEPKKTAFKGSKKTCMVGEDSIINLMTDMAPLKSLDMIEKIINKLKPEHKKRLLKKLGLKVAVSAKLKNELKKILHDTR